MIQQSYKNSVTDMSGEITSTGFTIEANASVYAMLTQNVYNDPILAVMREWSTNACDACLAANVPVEYDVHLPTLEEPEFYVRDYGDGLPPEDIVGLFSNLGASTKRESDLYNGTLGIGRMAGLAAADAFTVESYHKGMVYSYVVSMTEGIPSTLHLGSRSTDQRNGLKLSIAVDNRSFVYYKEKAGTLYKYFDYKPNLNDSSVSMDLAIEEKISDNWFIQRTQNQYDYNHDNYLVMAQVRYQIPRNSAINTHDFRRLVLKAPPGAVTFNPGRESLTLDKKTIAYLNQAFLNVKTEYNAAAMSLLASSESDVELVKTYRNITKDAPAAVTAGIDPVPFMSPELQEMVSVKYKPHYLVSETQDFLTATNNSLVLSMKAGYAKIAKRIDEGSRIGLLDFCKAIHVVVDMKTKYKSAINSTYANDAVVFWHRPQGGDVDDAVTEAKRYLEALGLSYKLASEVVSETPVIEKQFLPREGLYVSDIGYRGKVYKSQAMPSDKIEEGTYLYLPLNNTTPVVASEDFSFLDYYLVYNYLKEIRTMPPIKGVAKKYQKYIEDLDNWQDFETYIKDTTKDVSFQIDGEFGRIEKITIDESHLSQFPLKIQQYYENYRAYLKFCDTPNYVMDPELKRLLTKLGATVDSFKRPTDVTRKQLEERFPFTSELIFSYSPYGNRYSKKQIIQLAKVEEFYAVYSSE